MRKYILGLILILPLLVIGAKRIVPGTDALSLTSAGNLEVRHKLGVGTAVPSTNAEIQAAAGSAGTLTLSTRELTVVDADFLGQINFQAPLESGGSDAILVAASIWAPSPG